LGAAHYPAGIDCNVRGAVARHTINLGLDSGFDLVGWSGAGRSEFNALEV
jgi:hypothetical protein